MHKGIYLLWSLVAVTVAAMSGYLYFFDRDDERCIGDMVLPSSISGKGEFTATNSKGATVDQDVFHDALNLVYFGYTFCPDICPVDTVKNAVITDKLAERGIEITPYFVTVDPARDTVEVMNDYVTYTHEKMIGLTGTEEEMRQMQKIYGVTAAKQPSDDPEFYTVNHTGFSYLVDGDGLITAYSRALTADNIVDNIMCHINK